MDRFLDNLSIVATIVVIWFSGFVFGMIAGSYLL